MKTYLFNFLVLILLGLLSPLTVSAQVCDVDADGDIDRNDVGQIFEARGTPASGLDDPRDADGDGMISVGDARFCVLQCALPRCEIVTPPGDPRYLFADQIVADLNQLKLDVEFSAIPVSVSTTLIDRIDDTKLEVESGVVGLSQGLEAEALTHFKYSLHNINRYLKLLSDKVVEGLISPSVADPLSTEAIRIRRNIKQLINGDLENAAPIAIAGLDQTILEGLLVTLDGSLSSDPDDDPISYSW